MKRAVATIESKIDAVGVRVNGGFQVGFQNRGRHFVADTPLQRLHSRLDVKGSFILYPTTSAI